MLQDEFFFLDPLPDFDGVVDASGHDDVISGCLVLFPSATPDSVLVRVLLLEDRLIHDCSKTTFKGLVSFFFLLFHPFFPGTTVDYETISVSV